jgi:hypothetical protein
MNDPEGAMNVHAEPDKLAAAEERARTKGVHGLGRTRLRDKYK